jgi:hypothetical protein
MNKKKLFENYTKSCWVFFHVVDDTTHLWRARYPNNDLLLRVFNGIDNFR